MAAIDKSYLSLCEAVLNFGYRRPSRVGETYSLPGMNLQTSLLSVEFPILTTRKIFPKGVIGELAAFLEGAEDLETFEKYGCNYWSHNAGHWIENVGLEKKDWRVGRIYGAQWRHWGHGVDQLENLIDGLMTDKFGRRHILTTWNPEELGDMCLPPCHLLAQFYVRHDDTIDCIVYMRSVDLALGLPSDLVLYGTLLMLVAKEVNMRPGRLHMQFGDAHIYAPHIENLQLQLKRPTTTRGATARLAPSTSLFGFKPEDFKLVDYTPGEKIDYELF